MAAPITYVLLLRMPESSSTSGTQKILSSLYAKPRFETKTTLSPYRIETSQSLVLLLIQRNNIHSGTPLLRPALLQQKNGLSRGVASTMSGVEIDTFMFIYTLSSGLSRGGGILSGWPLKRGSTVLLFLALLITAHLYCKCKITPTQNE